MVNPCRHLLRVTHEPEPDETRGHTNYARRIVNVDPTYPLAEQVHILVHEVAHVRCDHEGRDIPRSQRETEAESVGSSLYQVGLVGLVPAWRGGLTEGRSFR